jgi:pancreatic triacylglycerol lipase
VTARNRVPEVANVLARFLNFLVTNGSTQMNRVNIAGHSLGAHIAGVTGKRVNQGRVQVIFGLDPAGPLFSLNAPNDRFASGDAVYTEGIRTNAGNLGFSEPLAVADFYPNWGSRQPGCGVDLSGSCSHSRAHEFFAESITSNGFVGRRCNNYQEIVNQSCNGAGTAVMGGEGNTGSNGVFFLETNSNSPFARG